MKRVVVVSAVVAAVLGVVALGGCPRGAPLTRARVALIENTARLPGTALPASSSSDGGSDVMAAAVAVERAVADARINRIKTSGSVHTAFCGSTAVAPGSLAAGHQKGGGAVVVVVDGIDGPALDGVLAKAGLAPNISATTETLDDDVAVLAVRSADPFVARDFVDRALRPALSAVKDVTRVDVVGGKRQRQVLIDLRKMLAVDLTISEILFVAGGGTSLEATVAKSSVPPQSEPMIKAALASPQPGELRVMLSDVADIGLFPVGEPLRRDGAVEVRVSGPPSARDAVLAAALKIEGPAGLEVAPLDDDSVEGVDVIVAGTPAEVDDLRRELLAIPGVRFGEEAQALHIEVDADRAQKLSVSPFAAAAVVDVAVAPGGHVLLRNTENVAVRLKGEVPPELLMQLVVARTAAGPVRLLDVATLVATPARADRLDGQPAQRVRVLFDVGVRKNALAAVEQAVARRGKKAILERRDVARGVCP